MDTIAELVARLEQLSYSYYTGNEEVDDATFDELEDKLRKLDPNNPYFKKNRETVPVYGVKANHIYEFIGSLEKIHHMSESKLKANLWASAKLDGTSLVTYFTNGKLDKAVTRGNGKEGMDVTQHYLAVTKKYSVTVPEGYTGAIRGEIVFKKTNWLKFKEIHPEAKAARNSGTGLINQKEVQPEEELLDYVIYDIVATNQPTTNFWGFLEKFGIPVAPHRLFAGITDNQLLELYESWGLMYPIDGIVLRQADTTFEKLAASECFIYNKKQEAYKFQAEIKEVEVKDITWQLGRTGKLTPVLNIEPTEMTGAIVSNITAHNAAMVAKMKLGKGAKVFACRSGDVIPFLKDVIEPAEKVEIPTTCPYCGEPLSYTNTKVDICCMNPDCPGKAKEKIYNFLENVCSDIKGLGDVFLETLVEEVCKGDYSIAKFIDNCDYVNFPIEAFGNADNMVASRVITRILSTTWSAEAFWLGLGIKLLGQSAASTLSKHKELSDQVIDSLLNMNIEPAREALDKLFPGQRVLKENILSSAEEISKVVKASLPLHLAYSEITEVRYYAITGSLSKPRKEIQEEFATYGWEMTDNLNKAKVLITNADSNSSKAVKAKQLGKLVMTEEQFRNIELNENGMTELLKQRLGR